MNLSKLAGLAAAHLPIGWKGLHVDWPLREHKRLQYLVLHWPGATLHVRNTRTLSWKLSTAGAANTPFALHVTLI